LFKVEFWLVIGSNTRQNQVFGPPIALWRDQRDLEPKSGTYGSMQFFMLFQNMTSKIRKKMKKILKSWKYVNQGRKVQKWADISCLEPIKIGF
jgi:hypothetical protein